MPVQYRGVLDEHHTVRTAAGVFDVSHLGRFEVSGPGAVRLLETQLCNDINKIGPGRAQYTMALNERGGIEDDIIVWWVDDERWWVMPNGTNFDEMLARFRHAVQDDVTFVDVRSDTVLLAVQGPSAPATIETVLGFTPRRFRVETGEYAGSRVVAAGTGYTGEPGAEICVAAGTAEALWTELIHKGVEPAGLGARDTLRLEMGFPLWGQDLTEDTTPVEAGLDWVVAWDHDFVGRTALEAMRDDPPSKLVAFTTEGRIIPRHGYRVTSTTGSGLVTSGNYSPTLGHGIGLAYVTPPPSANDQLTVTVRGSEVPATMVDLPFIDR